MPAFSDKVYAWLDWSNDLNGFATIADKMRDVKTTKQDSKARLKELKDVEKDGKKIVNEVVRCTEEGREIAARLKINKKEPLKAIFSDFTNQMRTMAQLDTPIAFDKLLETVVN
ncbi:hypothetical protein MBLNU230_g2354t1 [Neophaeotheca triangularis]